MDADPAPRSLQALGLSRLESEVYVNLLAAPEPPTAYRVAKDLGKPTANVYKAMESLAARGAVALGRGEPRVVRPVPAEEFLAQVARGLGGRLDEAREALARLEEPAPDEGVYELPSVEATLERARRLLARAEVVVVIEAFPQTAALLAEDLKAAVARGVRVHLSAYAPIELPGADVVQTFEGTTSRRHWRSEQLNLVVDGREVLLALLAPDLSTVHQTLVSNSLYLACLHHAGMMREHFYNQVGALAADEPEGSALRRLVDEHPRFHTLDVPGQRELFERHGMKEAAPCEG